MGWRIGIADIDQTTGSVVKFTGGGPQPMPAGIANQGLMGVSDGEKIHLFYMSYHYEYDPATDTYVRKSDVPNPRTWATCALCLTAKINIYLIGGFNYELTTYGGTNNNQKLNISNDTWEAKTPMPEPGTERREKILLSMVIYISHMDGTIIVSSRAIIFIIRLMIPGNKRDQRTIPGMERLAE